MQSFLIRNQLRQATNHIDMLEDRLEQVKEIYILYKLSTIVYLY